MAGCGRVNIGILAIAATWSIFMYFMYSNSLASCLEESVKLRMAVERKDRFVELLRDQNEDLKKKISKLQDGFGKSAQERMFLVKELRFVSNGTA